MMIFSRPKRILYRIVIPYTILFIVMSGSTWLFSAYLITRYLDEDFKEQMEHVAGVISQSSYILNPMILEQLKRVINAEIVLVDSDGKIISSTIADASLPQHMKHMIKETGNQSYQRKIIMLGVNRYSTIVHPLMLPERGPAFLGILITTNRMMAFQRTIILSMGLITLLGIIAMAGLGYSIARTITAPVEKLVKVTEKVAKGDLNQNVHIQSADEIGCLASAFNEMMAKLKDFEQRLVESEKMATAGQMAAGMAHEVRNPLTSIKMLAQILATRLQAQPNIVEILGSLIREIDRLDGIIQEIISKTRSGEPLKIWGNINQLILEVIDLARENFNKQGITVQDKLNEALPNIFADPDKIKQVIWNLILNAKEAMPQGGVILITTALVNVTSIEISVFDKGPGIVALDPERLFQPFFTTKPEGVGLGLSVSRMIIEKHGGKLTLHTIPGGGSQARIILPVNP